MKVLSEMFLLGKNRVSSSNLTPKLFYSLCLGITGLMSWQNVFRFDVVDNVRQVPSPFLKVSLEFIVTVFSETCIQVERPDSQPAGTDIPCDLFPTPGAALGRQGDGSRTALTATESPGVGRSGLLVSPGCLAPCCQLRITRTDSCPLHSVVPSKLRFQPPRNGLGVGWWERDKEK